MSAVGVGSSSVGPGAPPPAPEAQGPLDQVTEAARSVGRFAADAGHMGLAWIDLAKTEAVVAKASAVRLVLAACVSIVLVFGVWLFGCLALAYWLAGPLQRMDLAMAIVAGVNLLLIAALILKMRSLWRAMLMPHSRAALGTMAKALSS